MFYKFFEAYKLASPKATILDAAYDYAMLMDGVRDGHISDSGIAAWLSIGRSSETVVIVMPRGIKSD